MPTPQQRDSPPSAVEAAVAAAVSQFGAAVTPRLTSLAGEPEDQMRGPLEVMLGSVAQALGLRFDAVGESSLADLRVRPDYAAMVDGAISGYIEVKAPGKGADPTRWGVRSHDGKQWAKLKALPNVLYTDGQSWGLWRTGELEGEIVRLQGNVATSGADLSPDGDKLARLLQSFLRWAPIAPRSMSQLVNSVAPLTRLLRDEVIDTLQRERAVGTGPFTDLAEDWRGLLFPEANDAEFADGYAQSVAFALLLARTENIDFHGKAVETIARELGRTHSLMGKALGVLTDETIGALAVTLDTLVRVIAAVDFQRFAHHQADPYLHLYEHFLAVYDPALRRKTGSYYTPAPVVAAMTRLTDDILRTRLGRAEGLADAGVTVVDPAMGTGTYVLRVLETIAATVEAAQGQGAVAARLRAAAARIVGIEVQTGPYAVAELRVAAELRQHGASPPPGGLRLYVADTLDDPFAEQARLAATMEPIAASRRSANRMKAQENVVVCIGNPPYREHARGHGGFMEDGAPNSAWTQPPLAAFREPGNGQAEYVLSNLYVFFWRWATWKVFDAHADSRDGVICFITTSGYLKGPGFAGMRRYLRENASEGWVIDCTPEGHQPDVNTRIFGGVQQPVAIGIFVRRTDTTTTEAGRIRYRSVTGRRDDKFDKLQALQLDDAEWEDCGDGWTDPFLPKSGDDWASSPKTSDLLPWVSQGVVGGRTWVFAPLASTLQNRWRALKAATGEAQERLFRPSRDANLERVKPGLHGFPHQAVSIKDDTSDGLTPVPVSYRSFDVQYVLPDDRVLSTPRTDLWRVRGDHQLYITELHSEAIRPGPALTFAAHTPDMHHFKGSAGGRVLPLYASADKSRPNLAPGLLDYLKTRLDVDVTPEDVVAYIASVTAHPAFTARYAIELRTPGIRVPLTSEQQVWIDAVALGQRVLWLHTRGERRADPAAGRPAGNPRVDDPQRRPKVLVSIPDSATEHPDDLDYDPASSTLQVGTGSVGPVSQAVYDYEVSGMNVLRKWFGYRRATPPPVRGERSVLDDLRPEGWPSEYTTELLDLLNTLELVVELEQAQADLLERVVDNPRITVVDLTEAGVLPVPEAARTPVTRTNAEAQTELFEG
jgi:hypothetical protein